MASIQKFVIASVAATVLFAASIRAQDVPKGRNLGGLVTLYALDPVTHSFSFSENHAGGILKDHRDLNDGAEIDFDNYHPGNLTVAVSNGSTGAIVDLGTAETIKKEYQHHETVGGGQGFASIHRRGTSLLIGNKQDADSDNAYQELKEGSQLFGDLKSLATSPIAVGHIYVLRIVSTSGRPVDFIAKFKVVAFQPDQAVTIRWEILPEE